MSLNKCFKKIIRTKEEPGKGGFWTLDPQYMKEPASEDEDADEDELSKNLSDARIKSEMIKTEPLSPTLSIPASPTYVAVKSEPTDGINSNRKRKADPNGSGTKICLKFQIENSTKPLGKNFE